MGVAEVGYRLQQEGQLLRLRGLGLLAPYRMAPALDPKAFSFCGAERSHLPEPPWAVGAGEDPEGKLLAGEWPALGYGWRWRCGDENVWRRAPDTGRLWPIRFFADIDIREGNPVGDVRVAWEPSRLQQLVSLALFARHRAGSREGCAAASLLEDQLQSWVDAHPPWLGIHYHSAMECALRIIAVCHALDMVRAQIMRPKATWSKAIKLTDGHAQFIIRRLSQYSSCGNHTIAEAAGLVYAGVLYPELPGAALWKSTGISILTEQADRQILEDGGGIEQAFAYHVFNLELVALVTRLLSAKGIPVPSSLVQAERRGRAFVGEVSSSRLDLPRVGDSDGGYALSPQLHLLWEDRDCTDAPRGLQLREFPVSGVSLITDDRPVNVSVLFDHGPLGMPPNYGHGHADALAVAVAVAGEPILVDPGTYTYTGEPTWRRHFRGTGSHNTVCVDRLDQAKQVSAFIWRHPYVARLVYWDSAGGAVRLLSCHDGYLRLGVQHWRGIIYLRGGSLIVWDWLAGLGIHRSELHWLCAGEVALRGNQLTISQGDARVEMAIEGGTLCLHRGDTSLPRGWTSDQYGVRLPAVAATCTAQGALPHEFITIITLCPEAAANVAEISAGISVFKKWLS